MLMLGGRLMDIEAPTREWQRKFNHEGPALDQKVARRAWKRINGFEAIKSLEPEHRQAAAKLEVHYYGALGADVRPDEEIKDNTDTPDEFAIVRHGRAIESAKKAVGSPRVWQALIHQVQDTLSPQDIGHKWAKIKSPHGAKTYGEALIVAGLDTLCIHWGLITR